MVAHDIYDAVLTFFYDNVCWCPDSPSTVSSIAIGDAHGLSAVLLLPEEAHRQTLAMALRGVQSQESSRQDDHEAITLVASGVIIICAYNGKIK